MKSYHFSLGNSTVGPVGFCARIIAPDRAAAVQKLKDALPEHVPLKDLGYIEGIEYVAVYFNPDAITEASCDEEEDEEEGE